MNKKILIIISVAVIALTVLILASVLVYSSFFKDNMQKEEAAKFFESELENTKSDAEKVASDAKSLAKEAGIIGTYSAIYNEISENTEDSTYMYTPTEAVASVMHLNDDLTVTFDEGASGWWSAAKDKNGFINVSMGVQGESEPRIYLLTDNALVDTTKAVFWGDIPKEDTFDAEFSSGPLTLTFEKDGSIEAMYSEIIEEDGKEIPWNEAYSGKYKKDGNYLYISLNGSDAKYLIFNVSGTSGGEISGFASRYYIKSKASEDSI